MPSKALDEPMEDGGSVHSSGHGDVTPTSPDAEDVDMTDEPASGRPGQGSGEGDGQDAAASEKDLERQEDSQDREASKKDLPMEEDSQARAALKKILGLEEEEEGSDISDDDFASSAAIHTPGSSFSVQPTSTDLSSMRASDPEIMRSFYQRLFPWRQLFHWLNHSPAPSPDFRNREFAFTLSNGAYLRYQSYPTGDQLRADVLRLNPSRFEIGAAYSANPRDRKTLRGASAFRAVQKELCFDIDLTDYDDIRTCCSGAGICRRCWRFVTMAVQVVDAALREDFGFRHVLWVYSGRRGAHAWVCDGKARTLDDQKRKAIVGYLEVIKGGAQSGKKVNVRRPLHPHLTRSLDILKTHFQDDILSSQDPWAAPEQADKLLQLLPDRTLNDSLRRKWDAAPGRSSTSKWADIDALAKSGASKNLDAKALLEAKQDVVLEYTYPRLDVGVSKRMDHLLKSPFVVHPGTGRVCVPIDVRSLEEFDPLGVPTVQGLLGEIDAWSAGDRRRETSGDEEGEDDDDDDDDDDDGNGGGGGAKAKEPIADWEKTSLKPYVDYFRTFVTGLMKEEGGPRMKREREEGRNLDF